MNLNSLPDELLAGIFKYNKYETVHRIRKLDSRLNQIAKKYDLGTRIPVIALIYHFDVRTRWKTKNGQKKVRRRLVDGRILIKLDKTIGSYFNLDYVEMQWKIKGATAKQKMAEFLNKVQAQNQFIYMLKGVQVIDDHFIDFLIIGERCFRNVKAIKFYGINDDFVCSRSKLKQFLGNCKKLSSLLLYAKSGLDIISHSEVLGGRKWKELEISQISPDECPPLDATDQHFLHRVVKNCTKFEISSSITEPKFMFSVLDLLKLVEECSLKNGFFFKQEWNLSILPLGNISVEEATERWLKIAEAKFNWEHWDENYILCKIHLKPYVHIRFMMEKRYLNELRADLEDSGSEPD